LKLIISSFAVQADKSHQGPGKKVSNLISSFEVQADKSHKVRDDHRGKKVPSGNYLKNYRENIAQKKADELRNKVSGVLPTKGRIGQLQQWLNEYIHLNHFAPGSQCEGQRQVACPDGPHDYCKVLKSTCVKKYECKKEKTSYCDGKEQIKECREIRKPVEAEVELQEAIKEIERIHAIRIQGKNKTEKKTLEFKRDREIQVTRANSIKVLCRSNYCEEIVGSSGKGALCKTPVTSGKRCESIYNAEECITRKKWRRSTCDWDETEGCSTLYAVNCMIFTPEQCLDKPTDCQVTKKYGKDYCTVIGYLHVALQRGADRESGQRLATADEVRESIVQVNSLLLLGSGADKKTKFTAKLKDGRIYSQGNQKSGDIEIGAFGSSPGDWEIVVEDSREYAPGKSNNLFSRSRQEN